MSDSSTPTSPPTPAPDAPTPADADTARIRLTAILVGVTAALVLAIGAVAVLAGQGDDAAADPDDGWHGTLQGPTPRPEFTLTDTDGRPYDFAAETQGQLTLLFFGYTHCPDVCPGHLSILSGAMEMPGVPQPKVVFVTTDPARDTPQVVRRWLDQFSTEAVGLVGSQAEVDAAQAAVGRAPARQTGPVPTLPGQPDAHEHAPGTAPHRHDGPLGYGVGHPDVIFAFDTDDRMPVRYPGGTRPSDLAADLPLLDSGDAS